MVSAQRKAVVGRISPHIAQSLCVVYLCHGQIVMALARLGHGSVETALVCPLQAYGCLSAKGKTLDGLPVEESLDYLNGMTIALAKFVQGINENVELSDEDGFEKLTLSWLSAIDPLTGLKFSKYISTDCVELDLNAI